jgi:hypothetical protein
MNKTYAGIGSRKTPENTLRIMERVATRLEVLGYSLNSGGAEGADQAFAKGCTNKVVYIPWASFGDGVVACSPEALDLASKYHPAWDRLSQGAKRLMARNMHQILGADLQTPVDFVLCWTPDGAETSTSYKTGGTGQAIRLAIANNIPVFNLFNADCLTRLPSVLIV